MPHAQIVKGLGTVIYRVTDLNRAKTWYSAAFQQTPYFDQPFYVGFNPGGHEIGLLPIANPEDGALVYWGVMDVSAAVAHAMALGATEHVPASDVGDGVVTATVRLPDGAIAGFIYNPHFVGESQR